MILHGIYENGKIELQEKDLPKIRIEIEIQLPIENIEKSSFSHALRIIEGYKGSVARWTRDELHER
ncbi:MAG: hypothetical protein A2Y33_06795 [Spirochaetes bacterium GWF1_51_8]|nr:MAG: hypothetical protein A2Y33_06795 [Spirochaetes bacterium GWF1_51_8]